MKESSFKPKEIKVLNFGCKQNKIKNMDKSADVNMDSMKNTV